VEYIFKLGKLPIFSRDKVGPDILFKADYNYIEGDIYNQYILTGKTG